jgi:hypothetical protein
MLGLNLDQAVLAKSLLSTKEKASAAMKVLGIELEHFRAAVQIKVNGIQKFCLDALGIKDETVLTDYLRWQSLKKEEKMEEISSFLDEKSDESISFNSALTKAKLAFSKYKEKNKGRWKNLSIQAYRNKIMTILDECILNETMSWQDFSRIVTYSYFIVKLTMGLAVGKREEGETPIVQLQPMEEMKEAA